MMAIRTLVRTRPFAARMAGAMLLALALTACSTPFSSTPVATLTINVGELPEGVSPALRLIDESGNETNIDARSTTREVPIGTYTLRALEVETSAEGTLLPDPAETVVTLAYGDETTLDVAYALACETDTAEARETCGALPSYPQGYIVHESSLTLKATVQALSGDGTTFEARSVADVSVTDRYFTLRLPPNMPSSDLVRIGTVIEGFTYGQATCDRSDITIDDPQVRANDLFLDAYDANPEDDLERLGEVYLYDSEADQLVLWIYAAGPVAVTGTEACDANETFAGGSLAFDLSLQAGWNLVGFAFSQGDDGSTQVSVEDVDGPVGKAFAIMQGTNDDEQLTLDQRVNAANVTPSAMVGQLVLPREPDGSLSSPWNRNLSLQIALPADTQLGTPPRGVGTPMAVDPGDDYAFDLALPTTPDLGEGQYVPFASNGVTLDPRDPNHQPSDTCDVDLAPSIDAPVYAPAQLEVFGETDQGDPLYRGDATLTHGDLTVSWWYVPRSFTVTTDEPQNCRYDSGSLTSSSYALELDVGWNVVYQVSTPRRSSIEARGPVVFDVVVTTDATHPSVAGKIAYWRVEANQRADEAVAREGGLDGGSSVSTIRPRFFACGAGADCPLNTLHAYDADIEVRFERTSQSLPEPVTASLDFTGFDVSLPWNVAMDASAYPAAEILPPAESFNEGVRNGVFETCDGREAPSSGAAAFVELTLQADVAGDDLPKRMGTAVLHGSEDDAQTRHAVSWLYASESMTLRWRNDDCFLTATEPDDHEDSKARPVRFDIDLPLQSGWNVVLRTLTTEPGSTGTRSYVWRVVDANGDYTAGEASGNVFGDFRWYANLLDRTPDDPSTSSFAWAQSGVDEAGPHLSWWLAHRR